MSDERKHCEAVAREAAFQRGCNVQQVADLIARERAAARAEALDDAVVKVEEYREPDTLCDCRGNWNSALGAAKRAIRALKERTR